MLLPAVTIFFASALLFLVQPMTARQVLPLLGGTPAVWTTCMLFFQLVLLAGYGYAHAMPRWFARNDRRVHLGVLLLPVLPLVLTLGDAAPTTTAGGIVALLQLLATTIGLPFFVLATTSSLVQRWQAERGKDPYPLYAASNVGSLVGLLAYPTCVEPWTSLGQQRVLWTVGYAAVAVATALCALRARGPSPTLASAPSPKLESPPAPNRPLLWVLLAAAPSSLLLGVTQHLCTNLAPVPLLWSIPLALYLITFVVAFARTSSPAANALRPRPMMPKWLPSFLRWTESPHPVAAIVPLLVIPVALTFSWERPELALALIALHVVAFFLLALACHGRLASSRPAPQHLTGFYLWIAVGGALGGVANALVAPFVLSANYEYPAAIALACFLLPGPKATRLDVAIGCGVVALAVGSFALQPASLGRLQLLGPAAVLALLVADRPVRLGLASAGLLVVGSLFNDRGTEVLHRDRSLFGAHHVERLGKDLTCLVHGNVLHGAQDHRPERRREPLTYYHRQGPCGEVFAALAGRIPGGRVGAVGLGVGSIAAYSAPGERWTFYEIDAAVERTARTQFTFLGDAAATIDVVIGDGRLQLLQARDGEFGLVVLDAFNSDAVPVHLLTREALTIYLQKLAPGGVLAFHVSSQYVTLAPILGDLAGALGLVARFRQEAELPEAAHAELKHESKWVLMARRAEDLAGLAWDELPPRQGQPVWTDEYSSLLGVLAFRR